MDLEYEYPSILGKKTCSSCNGAIQSSFGYAQVDIGVSRVMKTSTVIFD